MKIALISYFTPTATNFRGASALPYHIIKYRGKSIDLEVWTFNRNNCSTAQILNSERLLDIKIHLIPKPLKICFLKTAIIRLFLPYPFLYYLSIPILSISEIKSFLGENKTNGVWIYGEEIARHITDFSNYQCVVTPPDCEAMYYYRMFAEKGVPTSWTKLIRYGLMFHRYAKMASEFPKADNIKYHLVGKEDTYFLKHLNEGIDATFIRHPHYDIAVQSSTKTDIETRPIRLLIAGRYDIYMQNAVDEAVSGILSIADKINNKYHITFLGKNWGKCAKLLLESGFSVESKGYVENYVVEVSSHDIQLTPISVGTGTKGKVLDAFANGVMVIGTLRALENIVVENGISCVLYETPEELANWLLKLADNPTKVTEIAKAGYESILMHHGREKIAKDFFTLF